MKIARLFVAGILVIIAAAGLVQPKSVEAADQGSDSSQTTTTTKKAELVYKYVAQAGDSYSKIARKAVQTYAKKNKIKLSNAKVLMAETNLTQQAGSPLLNLNQALEVKESVVKQWVDTAGKLTAAQEAAWSAYTVGVDFNTDKVGQR